MAALLVGLLVFLGVHSVRIATPVWRQLQIDRHGGDVWRGAYSALSAIGLVLLIWGFWRTRFAPEVLWLAPAWASTVAATLMLLAFVCCAASGAPRTRIRGWVRHPLLAAVVLWASAHLLANGRQGDAVLFGSFLVWGLVDFWSCLARERMAGLVPSRDGTLGGDLICVAIGAVIWVVFVLFLHRWMFGVSPLVLT